MIYDLYDQEYKEWFIHMYLFVSVLLAWKKSCSHAWTWIQSKPRRGTENHLPGNLEFFHGLSKDFIDRSWRRRSCPRQRLGHGRSNDSSLLRGASKDLFQGVVRVALRESLLFAPTQQHLVERVCRRGGRDLVVPTPSFAAHGPVGPLRLVEVPAALVDIAAGALRSFYRSVVLLFRIARTRGLWCFVLVAVRSLASGSFRASQLICFHIVAT